MKRLAEVLCIVRSNQVHGEKTPYGPDLGKVERDRAVSAVALPAAEAVIDAVLLGPSKRLAVYGSLAPGEPNHAVITDLEGEWVPGTVTGLLETRGGLPTIRLMAEGQRVPVKIIHSPSLPSRWPSLDRFEGRDYLRILATVELADGTTLVANLYADPPRRD